MKNFKRITAILLALVMLLTLAACGTNGQGQTEAAESTTEQPYDGEKVNVAAIKGPTGMGMVNLMSSSRYNVTLVSDPTQIAGLITAGDVDIAACPLNMAANIYNKTSGKVKMLGLNTLGVLYVVTSGGVQISSMEDLKGKTVYLTGQGATPEYIVSDLFEKNGIAGEVELEFLSEHSELAQKLIANEVEVGILPEPYVSVATGKSDALTVSLNLTEQWNKVNPDATLSMGCVIVNSEFADSNPEAVAQFVEDNKQSVEFVNTDPVSASEKLIEAQIIDEAAFASAQGASDSDKQEHIKSVISRCNIVFIDGEQMKTIANANFEVYYNASADSIGGKLPDDGLYYAAG